MAGKTVANLFENFGHGVTEKNVPTNRKADVLEEFSSLLNAQQLSVFSTRILPTEKGSISRDESRLEAGFVKRWIVQRTLDMGWTKERFGVFDQSVRDRVGREANKPERIGKKYQWIAMHEALARIADNFYPARDAFDFESDDYQGPWQFYLRDIDPTNLLTETARREKSRAWWFSGDFEWSDERPSEKWIQSAIELPNPSILLLSTNPSDSKEWINLGCFFHWQQLEVSKQSQKELWMALRGYIVHEADAQELKKWARMQDFYNNWMPEAGPVTRIFLREYYWSPAYRYYYQYTKNDFGWTQDIDRPSKTLPGKVLVPNFQYSSEHPSLDCSLDGPVFLNLPCDWIVEKMSLTMGGHGEFYDIGGSLIAFDPSVKERGPSCLLIRRDALESMLQKEKCTVFWTLISEKNIFLRTSAFELKSPHGRLEINGGYILESGSISGDFEAKYLPPTEFGSSRVSS